FRSSALPQPKVDAPHHISAVRGTVAVGPVSRILFPLARVAIIPLDAASPRHSSDLPAGLARRASTQFPAYLVLLRVGLALPSPLLTTRCALTAPFPPYPLPGGMFSVALSVQRPSRRRPGRYPARRSAEFGLSSTRPLSPAKTGVNEPAAIAQPNS